jgi:hypothetical protein
VTIHRSNRGRGHCGQSTDIVEESFQPPNNASHTTGLFEIVVTVAVQSVFCLEMHQSEVFLFFKKIFLTSTYQNDMKTLKKFHLKKQIKIFENTIYTTFPNTPYQNSIKPLRASVYVPCVRQVRVFNYFLIIVKSNLLLYPFDFNKKKTL